MTWTLHERTTSRSTTPHVRVTKDLNSLRFNSMAAELLRGVRTLRLSWDDDGRVAFDPAPWEDPNGYAVYHQSAVAWVQCWTFIRDRGYRPHQSWTLTPHRSEPPLYQAPVDGVRLVGDPVGPQPKTQPAAVEQLAPAVPDPRVLSSLKPRPVTDLTAAPSASPFTFTYVEARS